MDIYGLSRHDRLMARYASMARQTYELEAERASSSSITKYDNHYQYFKQEVANLDTELTLLGLKQKSLSKTNIQVEGNDNQLATATALSSRMQDLARSAQSTSSLTLRGQYASQAKLLWDEIKSVLTTPQPGVDTLFESATTSLQSDALNAFNIGGSNVSLYVENQGGKDWILLGRGRDGWEFDTDGQGAFADVADTSTLGTSAAFDPAAYSDAFINQMFSEAGTDLTANEVRIKRAANTAGTAYQEVRQTARTQTDWTWDFDAGGVGYRVDRTIYASALSANGQTYTNISTFDETANNTQNNHNRIWTFAWNEKGNAQGFGYGYSVGGVNNNDPNTFLWERTNENHATPYTEVYVDSANFTGLVAQDRIQLKAGDTSLGPDFGWSGSTWASDSQIAADLSYFSDITQTLGEIQADVAFEKNANDLEIGYYDKKMVILQDSITEISSSNQDEHVVAATDAQDRLGLVENGLDFHKQWRSSLPEVMGNVWSPSGKLQNRISIFNNAIVSQA